MISNSGSSNYTNPSWKRLLSSIPKPKPPPLILPELTQLQSLLITEASASSLWDEWSRLHFSTPPPPPSSNQDTKKDPDDKDNNDKDKLSSLLFKAFLWMLTAYFFIALISLVFPSTNQPEVIVSSLFATLSYFINHS
jgi:hypothetical protein